MEELAAGRIILGKVDAPDSVPGPGLEKKIENGVWLAAADPFAASVADDAARVEADAVAPDVRTPGVITAVALGAAIRGAVRPAANCTAEFKPSKAAPAPFKIPEGSFPAPVCAAGSI